ncbi:MAG: diaminopimelate epimerase [Crocinitomicaceae bacterium]|nr:diaminopimelate epimerase [Crocinitomicaceae bacterium]
MHIQFHKYQGTGNDFIMLDNRDKRYDSLSIQQIQWLCDRRFGIGADGLIKINSHSLYPFEVDYSNSDGSKSFCGNGARCAVEFASTLGINCDHVTFLAIDGEHQAQKKLNVISIQMLNVLKVKSKNSDFEVHTGSPHYIRFVEDLSQENIVEFGKSIRYSNEYTNEGINVNLVKQAGNQLEIATYERGVEDETLSCGTGVTAAAIASAYHNEQAGQRHFDIQTKGGLLQVDFDFESPMNFTNIWLTGPAEFTFKGELDV